jgi:spore coat protein U-like protein
VTQRIRLLQLAAIALIWAASAAVAQAALVCSAAIDPLVLGQVSLRDGYSTPTFASLRISCSGGDAGAVVQTCLQVGAGSGGAGAALSPRSLLGDEASVISYELTLNAPASAGAATLRALDLTLALDSAGNGSLAPSIYAQITALGATAVAGHYSSGFAPAVDLSFRFGASSCSDIGEISAMTVSADLTASCAVEVSTLDFGIVNQHVTSTLDSRAQIAVSCTNKTGYSVGLDFGQHASDTTPSSRRMANGTEMLHYGLYHSASRSDSWQLTAGSLHSGLGSGFRQSIDVFGRVFANQTLVPGQYSDTVVVVISY